MDTNYSGIFRTSKEHSELRQNIHELQWDIQNYNKKLRTKTGYLEIQQDIQS